MTDSADPPPSLETLARRYMDLWQDQWMAVAGDPEGVDAVSRLFQMMTRAATAADPGRRP